MNGVGFSPLSGEAAEPVNIAAQGPSVHGADPSLNSPALVPTEVGEASSVVAIKRCSACGAMKRVTAEFFYRGATNADGYEGRCKECRQAYAREKQKSARARAYDALRLQSPESRFKLLARLRLRQAVRSRHIDRPSTCHDCGTTCTPHGHHEEYTKPLDVRWLCSACHGIRHRKFDVSEV